MGTKTLRSLLVIILALVCLPCGSRASYNQTHDAEGIGFSSENLFADRVGDLFTVDIKDIHLEDVLKELSHDYGIKFLLPSSLADEKVMVRFSNLKLDKGIKKILAPYDTIFMYQENDYKLQEVRIYPFGYKGGMEETFITILESNSPTGVQIANSSEEQKVIKLKNKRKQREEKLLSDLSQDLRNKGSRVKLGADQGRGTIEDERAIDHLARAMKDRDSRGRSATENALKGTGEPQELTENDVENDESEGNDGSEESEGNEEDEEKNKSGQVEVVCTDAVEDGDNVIIPIKIAGDEGEAIAAWGLDIELKGLEYAGWTKSGSLTEESSSFMCNQLSNGCVRCGSYTGDLNIGGENTLFKLELKKVPDAKNASVQLLNFVDQLSGAKTSEYRLK